MFTVSQLFVILLASISFLKMDQAYCAEALYRQVPIPKREHGYGRLQSKVYDSENDFKQLLYSAKKENSWNESEKFVNALKNAKINFLSEALVFLQDAEGSGSVTIGNPSTSLKGNTLIIEVSRQLPTGYGTDDMAFYGFAFVIKKDSIKNVSFKVGDLAPQLLEVTKK